MGEEQIRYSNNHDLVCDNPQYRNLAHDQFANHAARQVGKIGKDKMETNVDWSKIPVTSNHNSEPGSENHSETSEEPDESICVSEIRGRYRANLGFSHLKRMESSARTRTGFIRWRYNRKR